MSLRCPMADSLALPRTLLCRDLETSGAADGTADQEHANPRQVLERVFPKRKTIEYSRPILGGKLDN
jgi:hypothetical protein